MGSVDILHRDLLPLVSNFPYCGQDRYAHFKKTIRYFYISQNRRPFLKDFSVKCKDTDLPKVETYPGETHAIFRGILDNLEELKRDALEEDENYATKLVKAHEANIQERTDEVKFPRKIEHYNYSSVVSELRSPMSRPRAKEDKQKKNPWKPLKVPKEYKDVPKACCGVVFVAGPIKKEAKEYAIPKFIAEELKLTLHYTEEDQVRDLQQQDRLRTFQYPSRHCFYIYWTLWSRVSFLQIQRIHYRDRKRLGPHDFVFSQSSSLGDAATCTHYFSKPKWNETQTNPQKHFLVALEDHVKMCLGKNWDEESSERVRILAGGFYNFTRSTPDPLLRVYKDWTNPLSPQLPNSTSLPHPYTSKIQLPPALKLSQILDPFLHHPPDVKEIFLGIRRIVKPGLSLTKTISEKMHSLLVERGAELRKLYQEFGWQTSYFAGLKHWNIFELLYLFLEPPPIRLRSKGESWIDTGHDIAFTATSIVDHRIKFDSVIGLTIHPGQLTKEMQELSLIIVQKLMWLRVHEFLGSSEDEDTKQVMKKKKNGCSTTYTLFPVSPDSEVLGLFNLSASERTALEKNLWNLKAKIVWATAERYTVLMVDPQDPSRWVRNLEKKHEQKSKLLYLESANQIEWFLKILSKALCFPIENYYRARDGWTPCVKVNCPLLKTLAPDSCFMLGNNDTLQKELKYKRQRNMSQEVESDLLLHDEESKLLADQTQLPEDRESDLDFDPSENENESGDDITLEENKDPEVSGTTRRKLLFVPKVEVGIRARIRKERKREKKPRGHTKHISKMKS
jgi:hypothetical protein